MEEVFHPPCHCWTDIVEVHNLFVSLFPTPNFWLVRCMPIHMVYTKCTGHTSAMYWYHLVRKYKCYPVKNFHRCSQIIPAWDFQLVICHFQQCPLVLGSVWAEIVGQGVDECTWRMETALPCLGLALETLWLALGGPFLSFCAQTGWENNPIGPHWSFFHSLHVCQPRAMTTASSLTGGYGLKSDLQRKKSFLQ